MIEPTQAEHKLAERLARAVAWAPESEWPAVVDQIAAALAEARGEGAASRDAEVERLNTENYKLREIARRARDETEDAADTVDALRRIGDVVGCGHVDGKDDRARLVRCVRAEFERLAAELRRVEAERDAVCDVSILRGRRGIEGPGESVWIVFGGSMKESTHLSRDEARATVLDWARERAGLPPTPRPEAEGDEA